MSHSGIWAFPLVGWMRIGNGGLSMQLGLKFKEQTLPPVTSCPLALHPSISDSLYIMSHTDISAGCQAEWRNA